MVVVYEETGQITTTPPPTQAALHQAVLRAHYQVLVWKRDIVPNPVFPSPEGFWLEMARRKESVDPSDDHTSPSTSGNHPPREMQMHEREVCRMAGLTCIDLCGCSNTDEDCKNKSVDVNNDGCNDEDDDDDDS